MASKEENLKALAIKLYEIEAVKFGNFVMKIGINSPIYVDLRVVISYPDVMESIAALMFDFIQDEKLTYNQLCGVPYTALPFATLLSVKGNTPMVIRRKEIKGYGTKKLLEGKFKQNDICLIIEDVISSGTSVLETANDLKNEGLIVQNAIVIVNREQGAMNNIAKHGIVTHSLFTLSSLLDILKSAGKIDEPTVLSVKKYISEFQIKSDGTVADNNSKTDSSLERTKMSYKERADLAKSKVARNLFNIMSEKNTNLCVAADLTKVDELLVLAESVGPYICLFKMHIDIVEDFSENFINNLKDLAKKHNFLIMEDRKFADIGNTVSLQYSKGIFKIANWADMVTLHAISGPGIIEGLTSVLDDSETRGFVLIGEMSSEGNLISRQYTDDTRKIALKYSEYMTGIVCQNKSVDMPAGLIKFTPGVKIEDSRDNLGQQYNTPNFVIKENGADVGIVGRGIIQAKNVAVAAEQYRSQLWEAYLERLNVINNEE